jgi:hypothetical protein
MLIQMATSTVLPTGSPASPEALPVELARALGDPLRWRNPRIQISYAPHLDASIDDSFTAP